MAAVGTREFGNAVHIFAEAIGRPGERRFRLQIVGESNDSALIWMEKEQLSSLGEAIDSVLREESYQYQRLPLDDTDEPGDFPFASDLDMRAGQLSLGLDRERRRVVIVAVSSDDESDSLRCEVEYRRAHELGRQISDTVAAGRPICPLCSGPIDPDEHVCVRTNGHHRQA